MNLTAVLVTGLFAGGVSCAAVQGGLLTGLVTRQRGAAEEAGTPARAATPAKAGAGRGKSGSGKSAQARRGTARPTRGGYRAKAVAPPRPLASRLADDLAPVGGFLAGKLVSHAALGALLGALGGVVELSVTARTTAQLLAGALVIAFGLAQLGVPGFRGLTIEPPAAFTRFVRGRARSQSALAPALLGFATVLVPCGVTLSVEALALTSGSALSGAATMAVFVLGTSPLFAALGYVARKAATAWQGRLTALTGVAVLLMGLYTFNGGLEMAGSPLAASNLKQTLGFGPPAAAATTDANGNPVVSMVNGRQEVVVTARTGSYSPANIAARAGVATTLIVRAKNADGCVRAFVIPSLDKQWVLPADGDTPIDLGVLKPGRLDYSCGMGMYTGQLTVT